MAPFKALHVCSFVLYVTTLTLVCVELHTGTSYYAETCRKYYSSFCWDFFIVTWAIALPVAKLSALACLAVLYYASNHKEIRGKIGLWVSVSIAIGWAIVAVVGWVPPSMPSPRSHLPTRDIYGGWHVSWDGHEPPAGTGAFLWGSEFYFSVIGYDGIHSSSFTVGIVLDEAKTALASVILCSCSCLWSFFMVFFCWLVSSDVDEEKARPSII